MKIQVYMLIAFLVGSFVKEGICTTKISDWHPNSNFFSNGSKEVQDKLTRYVTSFGAAPYKLSQEKRKKFGKVFSLWLTRLMNPDNIPSQDYIDTHIKLYPSKKNRLNEDLITLTYSKNNRQFYLVQTGGDYGELILFFRSTLMSLYKESSINVLKEIGSLKIQSGSKNYSDVWLNQTRILSWGNAIRGFIKKEEACFVFSKTHFYPLRFQRVFKKDVWFSLIDDEFKNKRSSRKKSSTPFGISDFSAESYKRFTNAFRSKYDLKDAQVTVEFLRTRHRILKTLATNKTIPFSSKKELGSNEYEEYWNFFMKIYNKTSDVNAKKVLLSEWNNAIQQEPKYFRTQIEALSIKWNKEMITEPFWIALQKSTSQNDKDMIIQHIVSSLTWTKEVDDIAKRFIKNKSFSDRDINRIEELFKKQNGIK